MKKSRVFAAITSFTLLYVSAFAMPAGAEEDPSDGKNDPASGEEDPFDGKNDLPGTVDATGVIGKNLRAIYDSQTATLTIRKKSDEGTGEIDRIMYSFLVFKIHIRRIISYYVFIVYHFIINISISDFISKYPLINSRCHFFKFIFICIVS